MIGQGLGQILVGLCFITLGFMGLSKSVLTLSSHSSGQRHSNSSCVFPGCVLVLVYLKVHAADALLGIGCERLCGGVLAVGC